MLPLHDISHDMIAISRIDALPTILEVVCRITGLGFAAVARVTKDQWVACAVRDEIEFGICAGGELLIETTICNEIRETGETVVIDHVAVDPRFCRHPTPAVYGFQSYISVRSSCATASSSARSAPSIHGPRRSTGPTS
jgi:GAF domain-containing protein